MKRTIGIDLGVTSASRLAVAEGSTILSNKRVRSNPEALTRAIQDASAGESVDLVLESTAMAWFVAGVAADRAGVEHRLHRVSGRKAAALRAFYRAHTKTDRIDAPVLARMPLVDDALQPFTLPTASELALKRLVTYRSRLVHEATRAKGRMRSMLHWAAPGLIRGQGVSDGFVRLLKRWPDLRQLARAQVRSIAAEAGIEFRSRPRSPPERPQAPSPSTRTGSTKARSRSRPTSTPSTCSASRGRSNGSTNASRASTNAPTRVMPCSASPA